MPAPLPPALVEHLRGVAKTFRTPDDVKAVVRAALAGSRPDDRKETTE